MWYSMSNHSIDIWQAQAPCSLPALDSPWLVTFTVVQAHFSHRSCVCLFALGYWACWERLPWSPCTEDQKGNCTL